MIPAGEVAISKRLILQDLSNFILWLKELLAKANNSKESKQEAQGWCGIGNIFYLQDLEDVTQVAYLIPLNVS